jgi:hypothetical protein
MNHKKRIGLLVPALALGGLFLFAPQLCAQENASFREINGTVEIKAPGSTVWAKAVSGDRIAKNTLVSTGFKSFAILVVGDSIITVRPVTRLTLEEIVRNQNGEQVNLRLQTGRIRAEVKPPVGGQTNFTVRTPTATASVRGTSFDFDTETLRVSEGRVVYTLANGRTAEVAAGGVSYVNESNNTLVSPFEAATEQLVPAPPPGSDSGAPAGDTAPVVSSTVDVGLGFDWSTPTE